MKKDDIRALAEDNRDLAKITRTKGFGLEALRRVIDLQIKLVVEHGASPSKELIDLTEQLFEHHVSDGASSEGAEDYARHLDAFADSLDRLADQETHA